MGMQIKISSAVVTTIRLSSAQSTPREACGLLFGDAGRIQRATTATNVAQLPERSFEIDPTVLFAALRAERAGGAQVLGYWHSHPSGDPAPSATDAEMAAGDGKLWLIWGGEGFTMSRSDPGGFVPIDYLIDHIED